MLIILAQMFGIALVIFELVLLWLSWACGPASFLITNHYVFRTWMSGIRLDTLKLGLQPNFILT